MSAVAISIVVPVTRPERYIRRLQESIVKQTLSSDLYETIMIEASGANESRMIGADKARGELIFFIDDDCVLSDTELLAKWLDFFKTHPQIDIAGGGYTLETGRLLDTAYNHICRQWQIRALAKTPHLLGGHLVLRKEVLQTVKFDRSLSYGGTESEFCFRAIEKGLSLRRVEEFNVFHCGEMTLWQFVRKAFCQGRGKHRHGLRVPLSQQMKSVLTLVSSERALVHLPFFLLFWLSSKCGNWSKSQ